MNRVLNTFRVFVMVTRYRIISLLLVLFTSHSIAGDTGHEDSDLSGIREAEREQIIKELTYRLDTKESCELIKRWTDSGSGADLDGNFYLPSVENNYYIIGGLGTQSKKQTNCVTTVSIPASNPPDTPPLLVAPVDWKMIWKDEGSGADKDGSMWEAIPPDSNYRCLGTVPQAKYKKPDVPAYRCVHSSLTEKIVSSQVVWSDIGSHAVSKVTMLQLPNSNSFITVPDRVSNIEGWDLKANPVVLPDPGRVDEILATRMAKIEQELQASMKEQLAQKHQAEAAEKQRVAAEEAEKKRMAEEAEKQRLAQAAEQKRIAEEAGKKRMAEAASAKPVTEKPAEMPETAVTEEQSMPEPPVVNMEPPITEDVKPDKMADTSTDTASSGGMNSFYGFLLKVFGTAFAIIFILTVIVYKLMSRKGTG